MAESLHHADVTSALTAGSQPWNEFYARRALPLPKILLKTWNRIFHRRGHKRRRGKALFLKVFSAGSALSAVH